MYDSTLLSLDKIGVDVHTNQFLVGFVEMFAAVFSAYIVTIVKRKPITIIAMVLSSIFTLLLEVISSLNYESSTVIN